MKASNTPMGKAYKAAQKSKTTKPNVDIPKPIIDAAKAIGKGASKGAKVAAKGAKVVGKSVATRGIIPAPPAVKVAALLALAAGQKMASDKAKQTKAKAKATSAAKAKDAKANKARQATNLKYDKKIERKIPKR